MNSKAWWRDSVIYQIYPATFADANGDGVGDLQGIIQRLDYFRSKDDQQPSLGIDALWICPIFASPMQDNGYDVSDYLSINPQFGTLADFDQLIAAAQERQIKIILDMALNHTSDQHAWFQASCESRAGAKADWYHWQDPKEAGGPPNNWRSYMGGSGWTFHEQRQQYYFHTFKSCQPDLNWSNPEVREAIADILRFWLERGVGGFRLDASSVYVKDERYRDNPLKYDAEEAADYDSYYLIRTKDRPENHQILREIRQLVDGYGDRLLIGETFINSKLNESIMFYGVNHDELHLPFEFEFPLSPWHPGYLHHQVQAKESLVPEGAWPVYFLDNHDLPRHLSRWLDCSRCSDSTHMAKATAALLLTLRGTPILYYGQEIGMINHEEIPPDRHQDRPEEGHSEAAHEPRDGARTPMQWDDSPQAGFSFGKDVQSWLPVHPDYPEVNVELQQQNADSIWCFYQQLLQLRRQSPALKRGKWQTLIHYPDQYFAYLRVCAQEEVLVLINAAESCTLELDEPLAQGCWEVLLSTQRDRRSVPTSLDSLHSFEVSVLKRIKAT